MTRLVTLLLLGVPTAHAGWKTHVASIDSSISPGRASLSYAASPQFGLATFAEAIDKLELGGHIDRLEIIVLYGGEVDPEFQREVIEKLKEHAPREFVTAKDSERGTYEDPDLRLLHRVFDEVILETSTVGRINNQLGAVGKRISAASHEKLSFRKNEEQLTIHFFLYLSVENL